MSTTCVSLPKKYRDIIWKKRWSIYTYSAIICVAVIILLMYYRAFLGTELTDEAFYVSEAKEMLNGNIPYAYAYGFSALGFTFMLIPVIWLYSLFVPNLAGIFLFTRLCFVTYKVIVWVVVYSVMKRRLAKANALLISALILPLNGTVLNFSYNTIPELTFLMVACLLYDVIEQDAPHKRIRLMSAGFLTGVACFSNPGWSIAFIIFIVLIAIRVNGAKNKIKSLLYFCCSVLAYALLVVISVSSKTSFSAFWYGFYRLYINHIPTDPINPNKTWLGVLRSFESATLQWFLILAVVSTVSYVILNLIRKKGKSYSRQQAAIISITVALLVNSLYIILTHPNNMTFYDGGDIRAYVMVLYLILYLIVGAFKNDKIACYLGIYQSCYVVAAIIIVSGDATIYRFINAYTVIIPIIYILIKNRSKLVKGMAGILAVVTIASLGYANFKCIYRDAGYNSLNYRVNSGVYKGIYTVEERAKALPELEEYLNSVIEENDAYTFRDNEPFAYLMVHKGHVCELNTWDTLQYTAGENTPSILFDYYRVRDKIPDKIIYIDYGRDDHLSILDPDFKYNDWVNTYYDLVEDTKVNDFFYRVMVFQYNGKFDGDYQWWIDTYWKK